MPNISNFVFLVQNSLITGCSKKYKQENEMKLNTHQYRGHGSAVEVMLWHGPLFFRLLLLHFHYFFCLHSDGLAIHFYNFLLSSYCFFSFFIRFFFCFLSHWRNIWWYEEFYIFILFNQHMLPFFLIFKVFFHVINNTHSLMYTTHWMNMAALSSLIWLSVRLWNVSIDVEIPRDGG